MYYLIMLGKIPYFLSIFNLIISFPLMAQELARLDNFGIEKINQNDLIVNLYITENCSVCQKQTDAIKDCVETKNVAAFMEGVSEEKLRSYVKRKKIPFKTYLLNQDAKNILGFGNASPSISIRVNGKLKNYVGLQSCDQIKKIIKADN